MAYLIGILVMVLVWIMVGAPTNTWNPFDFAIGTDGRRSTSKLQFLVWTAVVVFAYVTVYSARVIAEIDQGLDALTSIPSIPLTAFYKEQTKCPLKYTLYGFIAQLCSLHSAG
jgi:hypothetical protein